MANENIFEIPFVMNDQVTGTLNKLIETASYGATLKIDMTSDAGKVLSEISKISKALQEEIGNKSFDMDKLFNLNNAIAQLGTFKHQFEGLPAIFDILTNNVKSLNGAISEVASTKLDTNQFKAFQTALDNINTNLTNISNKLDGMGSNPGVQKVAQGAKEITAEMENAAHATDELSQKQKELNTGATATTATKAATPAVEGKVEQQNSGLRERLSTLELTEASLQTIIELFQKMEANLSSIKKIFVDVGDGEEFSPLLSTIDRINDSVARLNTSIKGISFNMNVTADSSNQLDRDLEEKAAKALIAYQRLFEHIKMSGVGTASVNDAFFNFDLDAFDTTIGKIKALYNFIERARYDTRLEFNGRDILKQKTDVKYWNQASAALREMTKIENQMNSTQDTGGLDNLFGKTDLTEVINQLGIISAKLDEISKTAVKFKDIFKEGFNITAQLEEINKLTDKVRELEGELLKVKSGVGVAGKTSATGANGEQLALENTLQATYQIQQEMARTMTTINTTMAESAQTATVAYDSLKESIMQVVEAVKGIKSFGVIDPVELQKANQKILELEEKLNAATSKSKKSKSKSKETDETKKNAAAIQEEIKATSNEARAKEELKQVSVSILDKIAQEIQANEAMVASTANKVKAVEALKHAYEALLAVQKMPLSKGEYEKFESNYIRSYASVLSSGIRNSVLEQYKIDGVDTFSVKEIISAQQAFVNEENAIQSINKEYDLYLSRLQAANELRQNKLAAEIYGLPEEKVVSISQQLVVAEEKLTEAWNKLNAEFARDPLNQARISAENLERELQILSSGAIRFAEPTKEMTTASTYKDLTVMTNQLYSAKKQLLTADENQASVLQEIIAEKEQLIRVIRSQQVSQDLLSTDEENAYKNSLARHKQDLRIAESRIKDKENAIQTKNAYADLAQMTKELYNYKTKLLRADGQEREELIKAIQLRAQAISSARQNIGANTSYDQELEYQKLVSSLKEDYRIESSKAAQNTAVKEEAETYSKINALVKEIYALKVKSVSANKEFTAEDRRLLALKERELNVTRAQMQINSQSKNEIQYQTKLFLEQEKLATLQSKTQDKKAAADSKQYYSDALNNEKLLYKAKTLRLEADKEEAAVLDQIIAKRQKISDAIKNDGSVAAQKYYTNVTALSDDYKRSVASNLDSFKGTYEAARASLFVGNPNSFIEGNATAENIGKLVQSFRQLDVQLKACNNDYSVFFAQHKEDILAAIDGVKNLTAAEKERLKNGLLYQNNKNGNYHAISENQAMSMRDLVPGTTEYQQALSRLASEILNVTVKSSELDSTGSKLTITYEGQDRATRTATVSLDRYGDAIEGVRIQQGKTTQYISKFSQLLEPLKKKMKELLRYFSSFMIIMSAINSVKRGIQTVRELDAALTELKIVTGSTTTEMARFQKQAQQVASAVAGTTLEVTKSATEWSRLGYAMADALELAEQSAIYSKIGATDINVATENLTATLQAFYSDDIRDGIISAGDAAEIIVDKLVNVGDKFASSAAGMGQGISKAGAALIAANNTLDESLALITAGTTILQNEDETASALRTISLRLRGTRASELEAAGEDTDGAIESISKLYRLVKDMTAVNGGEGVEIFNTDTGAYKSTYEILLEISKVWDDMTDLQQAGILETIAGKTRSNAAAAILSSQEILEDAYKVSTESAGTAAEKMDVYLTSIESHIAEFKQATSVMWENTLSSGIIKGFVDVGTAIVKATDKVGLLSVALAGIAGYFGAKGQGKHTNQRVSIKYA